MTRLRFLGSFVNSRAVTKVLFPIIASLFCVPFAYSQNSPPSDAFRVLPLPVPEGPSITPYLKYQTELAWQQDNERRKTWQQIRTEPELLDLQHKMKEKLLKMIGGLPTEKTPLNPQITGQIPMTGFHIEKLIFQSLPGVYVTALVYVPEDGNKSHPAVLVPSGHSENGKIHYQALCQHLVQHGYVVLNWDAMGQGERSQFWDPKKNKSRYNLTCGEHAILGNLAYLAGTNLARWEIWDGIRAFDYLLTRPDVDPKRINITGTSGGGFQTAHIAALDPRIKVAAPSCYITSLPMRAYNRTFQDPDSDPEQDLYGMISEGIDHPGLLLMMYPRPVLVAAAVLDFFPIEGAHKTVREVSDVYSRLGHADRIAMHEGYHGHAYSDENQRAAIQFLDHFNDVAKQVDFSPIQKVDEKQLQCTRTGQVMLDYPNTKSGMDLIREYYQEHKNTPALNLKQFYYSDSYSGVKSWSVSEYQGTAPGPGEIRWESMGNSQSGDVLIERYLLRHSQYLEMPFLYIHKAGRARPILFWLGENGKVTAKDWSSVTNYLDQGYDLVSVDPRGLGETRILYKTSPNDPAFAGLDDDQVYSNSLSSVMANYVYNSLLTGRPYFLQLIEDVEIASRFIQKKTSANEFAVVGSGNASTLANAVAQTLPSFKLVPLPDGKILNWSELVNEKQESWPVQYLVPGGAYVH